MNGFLRRSKTNKRVNMFHLYSNERGAMLPLFATMLIALVALTAVSIDLTRGLLSNGQVEIVSDSAAIAAAGALNGELSGWRNAKRRALIAIRNGQVHGIPIGAMSSLATFNHGEVNDEGDTGFEQSGVLIESGGSSLLLEVKRGFYTPPSEGEDAAFYSLEGDNYFAFNIPGHFVANAVQVTLRLNNLSTPIASLIGFGEFGSIAGQATALRSEFVEAPVAPIAIPACALLNEMQDRSSGSLRYNLNEYRPDDQCQREIVARELGIVEGVAALDGNPYGDPMELAASDSRRLLYEGIRRSETYPLPPVRPSYTGDGGVCFNNSISGEHANCKGYPVSAYLGVPGEPGTVSDVSGLSNLNDLLIAQNSGDPFLARIGAPFNPLAISGGVFPAAPGIAAEVSTFKDEMLGYIHQDDVDAVDRNSISSAFTTGAGMPRSGAWAFPDGFETPLQFLRNYPFRRTLDTREATTDPLAFLRLTWTGRDQNGRQSELALLMSQASPAEPPFTRDEQAVFPAFPLPGEYTNPLCHDPDLPYDSATAPARRVNIMLVGPTPGSGVNYCDIDSVFVHGESDTQPPSSLTRPMIIGFVRSYIFDFNVDRINDPGADSPLLVIDTQPNRPALVDGNPLAYDVQFTNPSLQDHLNQVKQFTEDHDNAVSCNTCARHADGEVDGTPHPECEQWLEDGGGAYVCPEPPADPPEVPGPPTTDDDGATVVRPTWLDECFGNVADVVDLLSIIAEEFAEEHVIHGDSAPFDGCLQDNTCWVSCYRFCGASTFNLLGAYENPVNPGENIIEYNPPADPSPGWDNYAACIAHMAGEPNVCRMYQCSSINHVLNENYPIASLIGDLKDKKTMYAKAKIDRFLDYVADSWEVAPSKPFKCTGDCTISPFANHFEEGIIKGYDDIDSLPELLNIDTSTPVGDVDIAFCPPTTVPAGQCSALCADANNSAACQGFCENVVPPPSIVPDPEGANDALEAIVSDFGDIMDPNDDGEYEDSRFDDIIANPRSLVEFLSEYASLNGQKCLPIKRQDQDNLLLESSWYQPEHRDAGWGCAGVRMRLSCEAESFLSADDLSPMRPILINDLQAIE